MKFLCKCGNQVRDAGFPNQNLFRMIAEVDLDKHGELIRADAFWDDSSRVFRCENCKRLWIFWKGNEKLITEYLPQAMASESEV